MALEFSSNWKKLQAVSKQESRDSISNQRRIHPAAQPHQNRFAKRKLVKVHKTNGIRSINPTSKLASMELSNSNLEEPNDSAAPASLAIWAEDNDISPRDVVKAYSAELGAACAQGSSSRAMNASPSKDVEIGQYVAMDCEMVGVGGEENRSVLARVSIVNYHGTQIYDSFVKPKETVTDWRTHISGVSPKDMPTARSFDEVRDEIAELLKGRVLIGHDTRHDLEVLMLVHPGEDKRDTSKLSSFRKYNAGKTPSLKKLAKEILGVNIQEGQHSSIEDAQVTMLLFRKHRQAFDAEHLRRFPQQKTGRIDGREKRKRKRKARR